MLTAERQIRKEEKMSDLKIDVKAVALKAEKLRNINENINVLYEDVNKAVKGMNNYWKGSVASNAQEKYNSIKNNYYEGRYSVMDNYANFLLQIISEGYSQVEESNKSLADQFK